MEGGRKGKEPAAGVVSPRASSVIGAVASLGTNLVLYPLDLIKVKLQARAYKEMLEASRFRALRTVVASTFRDGGLRAFYVGLTPGLIGPMAAWGSFMWIYNRTRCYHGHWDSTPSVGMTLVTNPIFVIKTRMQTATKEQRLHGFFAEVRELVRTEGLRGMYKGLVPALPLTCHAALHWTIFERFKQLVAQWHGDPNRPVNVAETFLTASSSKVVAAALTYPLHVMKTCMQSQRGLSVIPLREVVANIYRVNGVRGYYSGFMPHLLRTVPNSTVTLFFIERLSQAVLQWQAQASR
ncbi:carrier superfamily protein [Acanthamoeba castellanii str. Neff]|uniref:Carrier superfamily protein n=1 Tax=Acanthamoeba castellanii (strain ATCC 30010 / Neff) TaxID=1257118 RepID=L8HAU7_ACACF|nr:carrier superfamily protein [Acanthamoeba castellanii str. Neff]ELR22325.1 carrier superfamily protein [Acanthamoeba castellanii str. Neff]